MSFEDEVNVKCGECLSSSASHLSSSISEVVFRSLDYKIMLQSSSCRDPLRKKAITNSVKKVSIWLVLSEDGQQVMTPPSVLSSSTDRKGMKDCGSHFVKVQPSFGTRNSTAHEYRHSKSEDALASFSDEEESDGTVTDDPKTDVYKVYPIVNILPKSVVYFDQNPSDASSSGGLLKESALSHCEIVLDKTKVHLSERQNVQPVAVLKKTSNRVWNALEKSSNLEMTGESEINRSGVEKSQHKVDIGLVSPNIPGDKVTTIGAGDGGYVSYDDIIVPLTPESLGQTVQDQGSGHVSCGLPLFSLAHINQNDTHDQEDTSSSSIPVTLIVDNEADGEQRQSGGDCLKGSEYAIMSKDEKDHAKDDHISGNKQQKDKESLETLTEQVISDSTDNGLKENSEQLMQSSTKVKTSAGGNMGKEKNNRSLKDKIALELVEKKDKSRNQQKDEHYEMEETHFSDMEVLSRGGARKRRMMVSVDSVCSPPPKRRQLSKHGDLPASCDGSLDETKCQDNDSLTKQEQWNEKTDKENVKLNQRTAGKEKRRYERKASLKELKIGNQVKVDKVEFTASSEQQGKDSTRGLQRTISSTDQSQIEENYELTKDKYNRAVCTCVCTCGANEQGSKSFTNKRKDEIKILNDVIAAVKQMKKDSASGDGLCEERKYGKKGKKPRNGACKMRNKAQNKHGIDRHDTQANNTITEVYKEDGLHVTAVEPGFEPIEGKDDPEKCHIAKDDIRQKKCKRKMKSEVQPCLKSSESVGNERLVNLEDPERELRNNSKRVRHTIHFRFSLVKCKVYLQKTKLKRKAKLHLKFPIKNKRIHVRKGATIKDYLNKVEEQSETDDVNVTKTKENKKLEKSKEIDEKQGGHETSDSNVHEPQSDVHEDVDLETNKKEGHTKRKAWHETEPSTLQSKCRKRKKEKKEKKRQLEDDRLREFHDNERSEKEGSNSGNTEQQSGSSQISGIDPCDSVTKTTDKLPLTKENSKDLKSYEKKSKGYEKETETSAESETSVSAMKKIKKKNHEKSNKKNEKQERGEETSDSNVQEPQSDVHEDIDWETNEKEWHTKRKACDETEPSTLESKCRKRKIEKKEKKRQLGEFRDNERSEKEGSNSGNTDTRESVAGFRTKEKKRRKAKLHCSNEENRLRVSNLLEINGHVTVDKEESTDYDIMKTSRRRKLSSCEQLQDPALNGKRLKSNTNPTDVVGTSEKGNADCLGVEENEMSQTKSKERKHKRTFHEKPEILHEAPLGIGCQNASYQIQNKVNVTQQRQNKDLECYTKSVENEDTLRKGNHIRTACKKIMQLKENSGQQSGSSQSSWIDPCDSLTKTTDKLPFRKENSMDLKSGEMSSSEKKRKGYEKKTGTSAESETSVSAMKMIKKKKHEKSNKKNEKQKRGEETSDSNVQELQSDVHEDVDWKTNEKERHTKRKACDVKEPSTLQSKCRKRKKEKKRQLEDDRLREFHDTERSEKEGSNSGNTEQQYGSSQISGIDPCDSVTKTTDKLPLTKENSKDLKSYEKKSKGYEKETETSAESETSVSAMKKIKKKNHEKSNKKNEKQERGEKMSDSNVQELQSDVHEDVDWETNAKEGHRHRKACDETEPSTLESKCRKRKKEKKRPLEDDRLREFHDTERSEKGCTLGNTDTYEPVAGFRSEEKKRRKKKLHSSNDEDELRSSHLLEMSDEINVDNEESTDYDIMKTSRRRTLSSCEQLQDLALNGKQLENIPNHTDVGDTSEHLDQLKVNSGQQSGLSSHSLVGVDPSLTTEKLPFRKKTSNELKSEKTPVKKGLVAQVKRKMQGAKMFSSESGSETCDIHISKVLKWVEAQTSDETPSRRITRRDKQASKLMDLALDDLGDVSNTGTKTPVSLQFKKPNTFHVIRHPRPWTHVTPKGFTNTLSWISRTPTTL